MASPRFRLVLAMMAGSKTGETTAEMAVVTIDVMTGVMIAEAIATTAAMIAETTDAVAVIAKMLEIASRIRLPGRFK